MAVRVRPCENDEQRIDQYRSIYSSDLLTTAIQPTLTAARRSIRYRKRRTIRVLRASCLGTSSASHAGESCGRVTAAISALCGQPPCGDAEDAGQPVDLRRGEPPLAAVA